MPWEEKSTMSLRQEFVTLARAEGANVRALCRRFGISPKTGYKWLARFAQEGSAGLADQSRRPHQSPRRTTAELEEQILAVRGAHPTWGGRKIRAVLERAGEAAPAASTVSAILHRHAQIDPAAAAAHRPFQRFEHAAPNQLWQMDFKGHFALPDGRCHPLTVLDDHSRFLVGLEACPNEQTATVQERLSALFGRYGLPEGMLMDNGSPWGSNQLDPWTPLTVWLLRLGIGVHHGRPYHPQTQGKDERLHRTLAEEVIRQHVLLDLAHAQAVFTTWRDTYNLARPHEALGMAVPASRYQPSPRPFPPTLPPLEYWPGDQVRKVQKPGDIFFHGHRWSVGGAFVAQQVALRPTDHDGVWTVYFAHHPIKVLDERTPEVHP